MSIENVKEWPRAWGGGVKPPHYESSITNAVKDLIELVEELNRRLVQVEEEVLED